MDLYLSEEQEMIRTMVREFAQKEIPTWLEAMEKEERFPREIVKKMAENGLMGMPIPEKYGGSGADFLSYILAIEELSKVNATIGLILSVHTSVGTLPILYFGNNEQKERFIPKLASGEWLGAFAVTETGAGSDPGRMKTRAYREGEHYRDRKSVV